MTTETVTETETETDELNYLENCLATGWSYKKWNDCPECQTKEKFFAHLQNETTIFWRCVSCNYEDFTFKGADFWI